MRDIDVWADPVKLPQVAAVGLDCGTFDATCYTVWQWRDGRWKHAGSTTSAVECERMIEGLRA